MSQEFWPGLQVIITENEAQAAEDMAWFGHEAGLHYHRQEPMVFQNYCCFGSLFLTPL